MFYHTHIGVAYLHIWERRGWILYERVTLHIYFIAQCLSPCWFRWANNRQTTVYNRAVSAPQAFKVQVKFLVALNIPNTTWHWDVASTELAMPICTKPLSNLLHCYLMHVTHWAKSWHILQILRQFYCASYFPTKIILLYQRVWGNSTILY